ncbi:MAG TPA: efflux RND transporter periplasmic adaptor subunit [Caulobacteraceae bacterium]|nr:efflux RND transporter periplasmic adaptor subunit [Caulobacteraceae bacterium]
MRSSAMPLLKSSLALVLAAGLATGLAACQKKIGETTRAQARAQARTVTVATVGPREIEGGLIASGNLVPREDTAIFPQITGYRAAQILADAGAWVKAGQPLARLDDTLLRAQLVQQTALATQQTIEANRADAEAARVKGLDTAGILSQEQIDTRRFAARAAHAQASAQAAAAADVKEREALMVVRAPYAGLVIERNVRVGDLAVTTPWFRIARDGQIELAADVAEEDLSKLHPGDPARVTLADGTQVSGVVRLVSPGIDSATKLGQIRIRLPVRPDIRSGGFARATFLGATRSALAVPETAVRYDADGASVMVVGADDRLSRVPVTTGQRGGGYVELLTGPPPGSRIVEKAAAMFVPGDFVRPVTQR